MVTHSIVQASNARIASSLPSRLVAVFVGATSGIGETTLKQFAKYAREPRTYFVGRSQTAADRIISECKILNPLGEYTFIKADVSLMREVDNVCKQIADVEKAVNILFLSAGVIELSRTRTSENLELSLALTIYSRTRFIINLLPLLQRATALRRVVTVFAGTKEGPLFANDLQCDKIPLTKIRAMRGHMCSMIDFNLEAIAKEAPTVSFIHDYPGFVDTGIFEKTEGILAATIRGALKIANLFRPRDTKYIPIEECGERHLFLATSARYKPANNEMCGITLDAEDTEMRGSYGSIGGGVYIVDENMEGAGPEVETLLSKMREDGLAEKVWRHIESEFKRICG